MPEASTEIPEEVLQRLNDMSVEVKPPTERRKLGGLPVLTVQDQPEYIKMMVYGLPGVGKTRLVASAAEVEALSPVLLIDTEAGIKTLKDMPQFQDIDVIRVKNVRNRQGVLVKTAWEKLQDVWEELATGGVGAYKTIVIDSLSEAYELCMAHWISKDQERKEALGKERSLDETEQRDYGVARNMIRRMVRMFRDLPVHVLFTANETQIEDKTTGAQLVRPAFPGKLQTELPGFIDEIFYMYMKPSGKKDEEKNPIVDRKILAELSPKHLAKDRSGRMPGSIANPTMAMIASIVLSKETR